MHEICALLGSVTTAWWLLAEYSFHSPIHLPVPQPPSIPPLFGPLSCQSPGRTLFEGIICILRFYDLELESLTLVSQGWNHVLAGLFLTAGSRVKSFLFVCLFSDCWQLFLAVEIGPVRQWLTRGPFPAPREPTEFTPAYVFILYLTNHSPFKN